MRRILLIALLLGLLCGPAVAADTFLGTFYTRDVFDKVTVDGAEVLLVWGGTGDGNVASISVVASPTSTKVVGGYAVIRKLGTPLGQFLIWALSREGVSVRAADEQQGVHLRLGGIMLSKDRSLNLKLSLNKFLRERLSATYYINYLASADEEIERRITEKVEGYWRWIDIHWLRIGQGIFSISLIQINGNTIKENDRYGVELAKMMNEIQEELNQDTIPLLDFDPDPLNPVGHRERADSSFQRGAVAARWRTGHRQRVCDGLQRLRLEGVSPSIEGGVTHEFPKIRNCRGCRAGDPRVQHGAA